MKIKIRLAVQVLSLLLVGAILNGCALSHEPIFRITNPQNNNTFPENASFAIHVRVFRDSYSNFGNGNWTGYEWTMYDGNATIASGSGTVAAGEFDFLISSAPNGPHYVQVRARAFGPDPDYADLPNNPYRVYSDWRLSNEVCFYVGPNPPQDFCQIRTIAYPLTVASNTPSPLPPTPTLEPTATRVPPIPTRHNPNQQGGSGCSQYADQTACNLAGCSWNPQNSSCGIIQ